MADTCLITSTRVTFPRGATEGDSNVLVSRMLSDGRALVITEETPFYPLSHSWPDQQADTGVIQVAGTTFDVVDTLTAARDTNATDTLYVGPDIPVRKFTEGWIFFVAHVISVPEGYAVENLSGVAVHLSVDRERRAGLSATHTSTHLAGLALNKAIANLWRKEVQLDGLQHPDFDRLAMAESTIGPDQATDRYRLGKSLRKAGFTTDQFYERAADLSDEISDQVRSWLNTGERVTIEAEGPFLDDPRAWTTTLDGNIVHFPCGGTHVQSLCDLASVSISLIPEPDLQQVTMITVPTRSA